MADSYWYNYNSIRDGETFTVYINEGERNQIERWVLEFDHTETGGDLFGLWIDDRTAVVQFVLGPGKQCRRTSVSFYQDIDYLRRAGNYLTEEHGLCNIGQWHSHHRLGLTRPSGGDESTVWRNMPNLGLNRYIVCIATIDGSYYNGETTARMNPYLFEIKGGQRNGVLQGYFKDMKGNSPFRLDKSIQFNTKGGAERINKIVKFDQRKRPHSETENKSTNTPKSKQPKPEEKFQNSTQAPEQTAKTATSGSTSNAIVIDEMGKIYDTSASASHSGGYPTQNEENTRLDEKKNETTTSNDNQTSSLEKNLEAQSSSRAGEGIKATNESVGDEQITNDVIQQETIESNTPEKSTQNSTTLPLGGEETENKIEVGFQQDPQSNESENCAKDEGSQTKDVETSETTLVPGECFQDKQEIKNGNTHETPRQDSNLGGTITHFAVQTTTPTDITGMTSPNSEQNEDKPIKKLEMSKVGDGETEILNEADPNKSESNDGTKFKSATPLSSDTQNVKGCCNNEEEDSMKESKGSTATQEIPEAKSDTSASLDHEGKDTSNLIMVPEEFSAKENCRESSENGMDYPDNTTFEIKQHDALKRDSKPLTKNGTTSEHSKLIEQPMIESNNHKTPETDDKTDDTVLAGDGFQVFLNLKQNLDQSSQNNIPPTHGNYHNKTATESTKEPKEKEIVTEYVNVIAQNNEESSSSDDPDEEMRSESDDVQNNSSTQDKANQNAELKDVDNKSLSLKYEARKDDNCLKNQQFVLRKHCSIKSNNPKGNDHDSIATSYPEQKEEKPLASSDTVTSKDRDTSRNDTSIKELDTSVQVKESSSYNTADQNVENSQANQIEVPTIDSTKYNLVKGDVETSVQDGESTCEQLEQAKESSSFNKTEVQNVENSQKNQIEVPTIDSTKYNLVKGDVESNGSQPMHKELTNNNRSSRSIFDPLPSDDEEPNTTSKVEKNVADTMVEKEPVAPTFIEEETKHDRKESENEEQDLKEESEEMVKDTEIRIIDPGMDNGENKNIINENQTNDGSGVMEKSVSGREKGITSKENQESIEASKVSAGEDAVPMKTKKKSKGKDESIAKNGKKGKEKKTKKKKENKNETDSKKEDGNTKRKEKKSSCWKCTSSTQE